MKASKEFCRALVESMEHMVDACQDAAIREMMDNGNPAAPYILLDKIMEVEDRVREMARRGIIPDEVAAEAIRAFENSIEDEERDLMVWAERYFDDPPEYGSGGGTKGRKARPPLCLNLRG